jgi:L-lactate dehydrogenase complex protein LldG
MNGSRGEILGRVRRALSNPAPEHHHGHRSEISDIRKLFASDYQHPSLIDRFRKEFSEVSGEMAVCSDTESVIDAIKDLIRSSHFGMVAISRHALCLRLQLEEKLRAELPQIQFVDDVMDSENSFERNRLREKLSVVDLSITGAEYLIADIGTIVAISNPQASRQISLLPAAHLVVATPDQIFPNMAELFKHIWEKHRDALPGSALTLITGPSRTADIEKVLIRGVHGPTRLLAIILGSEMK